MMIHGGTELIMMNSCVEARTVVSWGMSWCRLAGSGHGQKRVRKVTPDEHHDQRDPDHRHRHPRRRAARPVDVTRVVASGATSCPTSRGTTTKQEEAWFIGDAAPRRRRRRRRWPAGTSTRRSTRAGSTTPTRRRGTPRERRGRDGRVRHPGPGPVSQRGRVRRQEHRRHGRHRRCSWRASRRTTTSSSTSAPSARAGSSRSPRCRSGTSRRRWPRSSAAPAHGHKGIVFTQDPAYFGLPELTDRYWDPMWALGRRRRACRSTSTSPRATSTCSTSATPTTASHANYAAMGVSFFMANARTIAQLITGGICHRFPELNFVSVESGVGWIPFALEALDWQWQNCGVPSRAPRVRPAAERVLPPPDLRLLLVRARHGAARRSSSSAPTTSSTRPTSRTRRACRPARRASPQRPDDYLRTNFAGLDESTTAQDPARQRRPHLPPRLNRLD